VLKIKTSEYRGVQNTGAFRHEKQAGMKISEEREHTDIVMKHDSKNWSIKHCD
jgi:hypothetical protein